MIVDDAMYMRFTIERVLQKAGLEVVAAVRYGAEAIDTYKEFYKTNKKIDLVLLDITMEDMDGIEVLKKIIEFDKDAKVIMCSAMTSEITLLEALDAGAVDFVGKPFEKEDLIETVKGHLN